MPFGFGLTGMRTTRKGRGVSLSPHFGQKLVRGPNRRGAVAEGWRAWVMGEFGFLIWGRMGLIWFHSCVCLSNVSNEVDIKNYSTSLIKC